MTIGIDISQLAFENQGVSNYLKNLVQNLLDEDSENEYILFYSSLRRPYNNSLKLNNKTQVRIFKFPPTALNLLWNKLHVMPIEALIGDVDVFITSDWVEPPARKAKKATIIYDLIIYKYPEETHNQTEVKLLKGVISPNIVTSQKRKLKWVKKESDMVFCISEATKKDAKDILGIPEAKLKVLYPGM